MSRASIEARATLLALRAAVPAWAAAHLKTQWFLVLPDLVPLPFDATAEWLDRLKKPVACYAFFTLGALAIGWWDASDTPRYVSEINSLSELIERCRTRWSRNGSDPVFLLESEQESLLLSLRQFADWKRAYLLPLLGSEVLRAATPEAIAKGADVAVVIDPPDEDLQIGGVLF